MIVLGAILVGAIVVGVSWRIGGRTARSRRAPAGRQAQAVEVLARIAERNQSADGMLFDQAHLDGGYRWPSPPPLPHRRLRRPHVRVTWRAIAAATLVALGGFAAVTLPHGGKSRPAATQRFAVPTTTVVPSTAAPPTTSATTAPPAPATTPLTSGDTPRSAPSLLPAVLRLYPDVGRAGDVITVTGSGLMSQDGLIVAMFGSSQSRIVCPTQTTCQMTVPSIPHQTSGTVPVTVTTQNGTSNPMSFDYSPG